MSGLLAGLGFAATPSEAATIDYERDIRPIFEEHCFQCHGPEKQKNNFRLDVRAVVLRGGDSGEPAILPGKADTSHLIQLVSAANPDDRMPPKGPGLSGEEIGRLKVWIDQGAVMPESNDAALSGLSTDHWAFQPLRQEPPPSADPSWVRNPIDAFIRAKQEENQLKPSPRASKETLIRRLYLVMHGLPPSPAQVEAFRNDTFGDAWARLVDQVLDSPRYGERWARHWLDLVRFGETTGFETNRERPNAWPYRDWVIRAFNEDKPYNRFVMEQIAGDALGEPVGTAYLVAGPHDIVKSPDINLTLMQRQDELADILNTTGTAFLGLTVGCARCHNHKFDPITQKDYYAMQAVFAGVEHAERAVPLSPRQSEEIARLDRRIADLRKSLTVFLPNPEDSPSGSLRPAVNARHNTDLFPPVQARFIRFTIEKSSASEPCIDELEIFAGERNVALASAGAVATSGGDFVHPLHKLEHINDGRYGNARSWIAREAGGGWVQIELPEPARIDRIEWARDREGQFADRVAVDYRIEAALEPGAWTLLASSATRQPFGSTEPPAPDYDFSKASPEQVTQGRQWLAELDTAQRERDRLRQTQTVYAGQFNQPGPTHRLYRGDPMAQREEVAPDAIEVMGSLGLETSTPEQRRRLAFAQWLVRPDNPLTARVMANRIWQFHFGAGLVDTPSDFGANGVPPSHPLLLDWLARELQANRWSLKHIHRVILLSSTWQQDSRPDAAALRVDGTSRLLWRFPPRRLEAEAIRDCILATSGVLDLSMGGPGFSAFEVDLENVRHYFPKKSYGPEDWRRMIYMTKVRQEQDSVFGAFDCPDASQVMPKRSRSTTPLQALNLLNSAFVLQQSDLLAERLRSECGASPEGQVRQAYELCFGREPGPAEVDEATAFIREEGLTQFARALFNANEFLFIP